MSEGTALTRIDPHLDPEEFAAAHRLANALLPSHRLRAALRRVGGRPSAVLALPTEELRGPAVGLTEKQALRVADARREVLPARLVEKAVSLGAWVLLNGDDAYPSGLAPLADAPPMLFVRGDLYPDDRFSLAIVGSRRATLYGRGQAERFAQAFAERGLVVVSGGAAGIDTAAHRGALKAGGRTIAVLGCGIDIAYPAENRSLFAEIPHKGGAVLSEFPLGTTPEPWRFPTRNRIIAGITRGTVVIESPRDSGAMITARNAGEYGREVWAVPGPVDSGRSSGGHRLIQDGANLADGPEDVLEALGLLPPPTAPAAPAPKMDAAPAPQTGPPASPTPPERVPASPPPLPPIAALQNLTPDEQKLLAGFDLTPQHLDVAGAAAKLSAAQATVAATLLEMKGLIRRQPGNLFTRVL